MEKAKKQIRVLVAEDNRELCGILEGFFSFTPGLLLCGIARNGRQALQEIRDKRPDVVLLDIIMPELDGISVLRELKQMEMKSRPKVIVASAINQEALTKEALSLGASFYIMKPYDLLRLSSLMERVFLGKRDSDGREKLSASNTGTRVKKQIELY